MLRGKLQANGQLLLGGKGQRGERAGWVDRYGICQMGESCLQARLHESALCPPTDRPDSQRLQGRGQQAGPSLTATGSSRPRLEQSSVFTLPPGGMVSVPCTADLRGHAPIPEACVGTLQGWLLGLGPYPRRLWGHHCPGRWQASFRGFSKTSQNIHPLTYLNPSATLSLDGLEPNHRYVRRHPAPTFQCKAWDPHPCIQRQRLPVQRHTDTHTQVPSHCQEGPSGHGSSRPLPGRSILWCRPGEKAVPERPDAANRFLGGREGGSGTALGDPTPSQEPKMSLLRRWQA